MRPVPFSELFELLQIMDRKITPLRSNLLYVSTAPHSDMKSPTHKIKHEVENVCGKNLLFCCIYDLSCPVPFQMEPQANSRF